MRTAGSPVRRRVAWGLLPLLLIPGMVSGLPAETFVPEVIVAARNVVDPEFVPGTLGSRCPGCVGMAAYLRYDDAGRACAAAPGLWGAFVAPVNRRGELLTRFERCIGSSAPMGGNPFLTLTNGPEWLITDRYPEVFFTGARGDDPASPEYVIRRFHRGPEGFVTTTLDCPGSVHTPIGSLSPSTRPPFVVFSHGIKGDMHRSLHVLEPDGDCRDDRIDVLPTLADGRPNPQRRVVEGQRGGAGPDLLLPAFQEADDRVQIFSYDVDSPGPGYGRQMTTDDFQKRTVFAWHDPVVENDFVFFAVEASPEPDAYLAGTCTDGSDPDRGMDFHRCHRWTQLGLYRVLDGVVTKVGVVHAPDGLLGFTDFFSTEPFVFEGRSYVSTELRNAREESQIWILRLDFSFGVADLLRRVDGGIAGIDPEPLVRGDTVHIYFTAMNGSVLLRSATGL